MRFAVNLPCFGDLAEPRNMVDLAVAAEDAGWDGFFVWDHLVFMQGVGVGDPWTALAVIASATERLRLGPMVTPLPRRRPWVVARQTVALDQLSNGRLVLGVGLGTPVETEYAGFGEETGARVRAAKLDESLEIITGLWSGEEFGFAGDHYQVSPQRFLPIPVQRPRIPIWVAGEWPNRRPMRRAARFDGVFPIASDFHVLGPDEMAEIVAYVEQYRVGGGDFDVSVGVPRSVDPDGYRQAGVTWFQVTPSPEGESLETTRAWIAAGPPG